MNKNSKSLAEEASQLFVKGDILSPSVPKLTEHLQALLSYNAPNDAVKYRNKEYANTLKDIIAIKTTENLHKRTSMLTWVVISIASINAIVGIIYIWLLCSRSIHEKEIYKQQTEINQSIIKKLGDLNTIE